MAEKIVDAKVLQELREGIEKNLAALLKPDPFGFTRSFAISKVDEAKREVTGTATTEDLDAQGEVIDYEASKSAFGNWAGNIREMHQPIACGRAVDITCDDANKCVVVTSRISRGAQSTFEKILDRTLGYYSIGGQKIRAVRQADGTIRITKYVLNELSLVDVGANRACEISLVKTVSGVPTQSDILLSNQEGLMSCAVSGILKVQRALVAGARPLPQEIEEALADIARNLGTPNSVSVTTLASIDFAARGPQIAKQLGSLVGGIEVVTETTVRDSILRAAQAVLLGLVQKGSTRPILKATGARDVPAPPTYAELVGMEATLSAAIRKWDADGLPQNGKEYERLTRQFFKVSAMVRRAERAGLR